MIHVSPTEPEALKALGEVSGIAESYGMDFIIDPYLVGVQRKTVTDLCASMTDGRLYNQLRKADKLTAKVLILEGYPIYTTDDILVDNPAFTRKQIEGQIRSLQFIGGYILRQTDNMADTARELKALDLWVNAEHHSLFSRPGKQAKNEWGQKVSDQEHLLMGLPGCGYKKARAILDAVGMPLAWREVDLTDVPGIGEKTAEKWKEIVDG